LLPAITGSEELRVPTVTINQAKAPGSFAWWVGDEGVKARVDLAKPKDEAPSTLSRQARSQSALEPGLLGLGAGFEQFGPDATLDKTGLISIATVNFATTNPDLPRIYFDDLTSGGVGLPVNVALGRFKTDLSILFDRSQQGKPYIAEYLGASGNNGLPSQTYTVSNAAKFYLSDTIRTRVATGTGPNWGILWNYARLWKNITNQQMPIILVSPALESDVRNFNWMPYTESGNVQFSRDRQHINSPLTPVVSQLQIGFRLKTSLIGTLNADPNLDRYQLQMQVKPVVGIWNPYNVPITATKYIFDWGIFPYLRYNSGDSAGNGKTLPDGSPSSANVWLRDQWKFQEGPVFGQTRLTLETDPVDLQPGEFRLFSASAAQGMVARNKLVSAWNEEGAYEIDLIKEDGTKVIIPGTWGTPGMPRYLWIGNMFLDDVQKTDVPTTVDRFPLILKPSATRTRGFMTFKATNDNGSISRCADIWNTGTSTDTFLVPERILSDLAADGTTTKPKYKITDLARPGGYQHLATWSFFLRTTTQMEDLNGNQRLRGWVDANPRSLSVNPRWEGTVASDGTRQGWNFTSALMGGAHGTGLPAKVVGDGGFGNRGLVAEGPHGSGNIEPQISTNLARYQGLGGASNTAVGGQPNVIIHDVPRSPLISIGQFQHAQLSRYSFEPGFVVGNSYADLKIPIDKTIANNFNGFTGHNISDISYEINKRLWDDFYFSTLGLDYQAAAGTTFDSVYGYAQSSFPLANPRLSFVPLPSDTSLDKVITDAGNKVPEAISARVRIGGAFNINSTSKTAWKAVLASMGASELPRIDPGNPAAVPVWEKPTGIRFNRFGHVATAQPFTKVTAGGDPAFWLGWRQMDADELDKLATAIVEEVKARGPFRSFAEFVNRNPSSTNIEHQRKGALQAAIDRTVNAVLPTSVSDKPAQKPSGTPFSNAVSGESQAVGHAAYLMQGDLLQSLGPILQARSDYFRIRTCGQAFAADGTTVLATAWCEAFVQRLPAYVDPSQPPETRAIDLNTVNKTLGRRFEIVSFRWLTRKEI